jgi:NAD(P) transhydrogenase
MDELFDLAVIGSGPAGQKAALQGAKAGKKVVVIEDCHAVGGGCVHMGTLPSKSLRESVYRFSLSSRGFLGQEAEHAGENWRFKRSLPDMRRLLRRRDRVVSGESQVIFDQLKRNDIKILHGRARFVSAHELEVVGTKKNLRIQAKFIFIATGAKPQPPKHIDVDHERVHDSDSILRLKRVPKSMVILGGGVIGCEYASMFAMAGTHVTLVDKRHEVLASVDREIVNHLLERFESLGMKVILKAEATEIRKRSKGGTGSKAGAKSDGVVVTLSSGEKIQTDAVLVALGRVGNTDNLGLENVGIKADPRGLLTVDTNFRTSVPHIYAVGDVIGAPALAATSMEQGRVACCHAFNLTDWGSFEMPDVYPYGIYTIPEISMVGLTEQELKKEKVDYVIGRARYREIARGQIVGDKWGLLKLCVDRKTLKILGVHIIGDNAAELIHIGQAVMKLGGDVRYFVGSVFNYPTHAEAYKTAGLHAYNVIKGTTKTR